MYSKGVRILQCGSTKMCATRKMLSMGESHPEESAVGKFLATMAAVPVIL